MLHNGFLQPGTRMASATLSSSIAGALVDGTSGLAVVGVLVSGWNSTGLDFYCNVLDDEHTTQRDGQKEKTT